MMPFGEVVTTYYVRNDFQNQWIKTLKRTIEDKHIFSPRLYVHLTFSPLKSVTIDGKTEVIHLQSPSPKKAQKHFNKWITYISRKYRAHILPWVAVEEDPEKRVHLHAIISSDVELPTDVIDRWKDQHGERSQCVQYDKTMKGVEYVYDHHSPCWDVKLVCPKSSGSCRRNSCIYKRRGTEKRFYTNHL